MNDTSSSNKLASLCGFNRPDSITSYSNFIQINFQTDNDQDYKGFIGVYKTVECKKR
jgi:hypothetical protein